MKKISIILTILLFAVSCFPQSAFDKALKNISDDLANKLKQRNSMKVVVLFITDINKTTTTAGKYLADNVSFNIVNYQELFKVFERENLSSITEAKKIMDEGYIDAEKTQKLGKMLAVNAIIIGNYTVLSNTIKLTLKALSAEDGFTIASSMIDLPLNADAGALLGINISNDNNVSNRGFNTPINSNEQINNPQTVNSECAQKNTGDYCFTNSTNRTLYVFLNNTMIMSLASKQTQCKYNLQIGSFNYTISNNIDISGGINVTTRNGVTTYTDPQTYRAYGEINVERCKSKTFLIK